TGWGCRSSVPWPPASCGARSRCAPGYTGAPKRCWWFRSHGGDPRQPVCRVHGRLTRIAEASPPWPGGCYRRRRPRSMQLERRARMSVVASRVTPTPSDQARSLGTWWWVWTLPAVVAFAVSSIRLGRRQLWRDELATWVAARLSYPELAEESTRVDAVHGPYYALMHAWVGLVGDSEVALRLPSVLAAAVAAGATAEIGRRLYGPYAGLLAGLVLATAPAMSRYAQEARQYS